MYPQCVTDSTINSGTTYSILSCIHVSFILKYLLKTDGIGRLGNHAMTLGGDHQEQDGGLYHHVL